MTFLHLLCLSRGRSYHWSEIVFLSHPYRYLGQNRPTDTRIGPCDTGKGSEKEIHVNYLLLPRLFFLINLRGPRPQVLHI